MPSVTGPDGRKLSFPEGTPREQVVAVLRQQYPDADWGAAAPASPAVDPAERARRIQAQERSDRELYDPTRGESFGTNLLAGVGKSIVDTGRGLYQAGVDAASRPGRIQEALFRAAGMEAGAERIAQANAGLSGASQRLEAEEAERRRLDAPLMDTGGGLAGNIAGTVAQFVGPGILARGTAAGAALLPRTIRGNAALGAVSSFLQPNTGAADQAVSTAAGGALGGAGAVLPRAAVAAGGYLNRLRSGVDTLTQRAGSRIADAATSPGGVRFEPSGIPGVNRTAGEATTDPGIQALEQTMRQQFRGQFQQIDRANNLARARFIEGQAMTPAERAEAVAARDAAATDARDAAMQAGPVDIGTSMRFLDDLIAQREGNREAQAALADIRDRFWRVSGEADGLTTSAPEDRIAVLDELRQVIGREISKAGDDRPLQQALIRFRDSLNRDIGSQVPQFTDYLDAYRRMSPDINRSDIWSELADRASAAPDPETGFRTLTPGQFFRATNDLDALAQRATDFSRARAEDILTAADMYAIRSLSDDLSRVASRQQSPAAGSNTAGHLAQLARQMGRGATSGAPLVGQSIDAALGALDDATQQKMLYLITNPTELERVLRVLPSRDRVALQTLAAQLGVSVPATATRAAAPELTN